MRHVPSATGYRWQWVVVHFEMQRQEVFRPSGEARALLKLAEVSLIN